MSCFIYPASGGNCVPLFIRLGPVGRVQQQGCSIERLSFIVHRKRRSFLVHRMHLQQDLLYAWHTTTIQTQIQIFH